MQTPANWATWPTTSAIFYDITRFSKKRNRNDTLTAITISSPVRELIGPIHICLINHYSMPARLQPNPKFMYNLYIVYIPVVSVCLSICPSDHSFSYQNWYGFMIVMWKYNSQLQVCYSIRVYLLRIVKKLPQRNIDEHMYLPYL